jgi:hypothetical protein
MTGSGNTTIANYNHTLPSSKGFLNAQVFKSN